jgi:hypothetical protein
MLVTMLVTVAGMIAAAPANAHQSPLNCNANELDTNLTRDKRLVKPGDTIFYQVTLNNLSTPGSRACDVSRITLRLQFPGPDGQSSGPIQTLTTNANYAAEQPTISFGPFPHVVRLNPGVKRLEARITVVNGELHDGAVHSDVDIDKTIGSDVPTPGIQVDKSANIRNGLAPQRVTYTFLVYNRTSPPLPLSNVTLTDNQCPNVVRAVPNGDTNNDNRLDPTEVWRYTCTMDHGVGVFNNTAQACAELILNGGPMPKVCDTDQETVQFTAPPPAAPPAPPAPQVAVKPTTAAQAPCTLSTPRGLRVRAGQLNTIRVRVRNVDAGSKVTLTLPGTKKKYTAKTNANGVATLRVRPTKSGRARLTVAECSEVENLQVRPARRVVAQRNPRVTG